MKRIIHTIFLSFCVLWLHADKQFILPRVHMPDHDSISRHSNDQFRRNLTKYTKSISAAISLSTILYLAYQIHQYAIRQEFEYMFLEQEKRLLASDKRRFEAYLDQVRAFAAMNAEIKPSLIPAVGVTQEPMRQGFLNQIFSGVKSFGLTSSKFIADSILLIVSGSVANYVYDSMKDKINQAFADETVFWYIKEQTKMAYIFSDLKIYAVDYDFYATALSSELFNQDAQVHMRALVKDLHDVSVRKVNFDESSVYLNYLFDEIKKKYIKKSSDFESRQDFVDMALIKKHRAEFDQDALFLFEQDMNRRKVIAQILECLVCEMQRIIGFVAFKTHMDTTLDATGFISELVDINNKFLDHMETLLNATLQDLTMYSKQDQGMFTTIYEYEKIFNEQMSFLHRYSKYLS